MVPKKAAQDDLICVLRGCSVPVVLRNVGDDAYRLVGECFLDGFMTGEAFDAGYNETTFYIH